MKSDAILRCTLFVSLPSADNFYQVSHVPPLTDHQPPAWRTRTAAVERGLLARLADGDALVATDAGREAIRDAGWLLYAGAQAR